MSYLVFFFIIIFFLIIIEIFLNKVTKIGKKKFQWLIDSKDFEPNFDKKKLNFFIKNSFDKELGWIRKPNTFGEEKSFKGKSYFSIDKSGCRTNPNNNKKFKEKIATFGDSFTFCRQVNNDETWQSYLSKSKKINVLNYGVGNYGADQALIYSKRIIKKKKFKFTILGIVPETILRVHSSWKHYYEYGNIFGFKPRFKIKKNKLTLIKNIINSQSRLKNYKIYLNEIQKNDYFFDYIFTKEILNKPLIFSYLKSFRNLLLLFHLFFKNNYQTYQKFVIQKNHLITKKFYKKKDAVNLLFMIFKEFLNFSKKNDSNPYILILPQINDIEYFIKHKKTYYENLLKMFNNSKYVIDLTPKIASKNDYRKYYINDKYGGHLSPQGNLLVSKEIEKKIYFKN